MRPRTRLSSRPRTAIGVEASGDLETQFYGGSFVAGETGLRAVEFGEDQSLVAVAEFDLDRIAEFRKAWGIFRTRRTDRYGPLRTQAPPDYLRVR